MADVMEDAINTAISLPAPSPRRWAAASTQTTQRKRFGRAQTTVLRFVASTVRTRLAMSLPFRLLCALPACDKPSWVLPVAVLHTVPPPPFSVAPVSPRFANHPPNCIAASPFRSRRKILCDCGDQLNSNVQPTAVPPVLLPHLSRLKLEYFEDESVLAPTSLAHSEDPPKLRFSHTHDKQGRDGPRTHSSAGIQGSTWITAKKTKMATALAPSPRSCTVFHDLHARYRS